MSCVGVCHAVITKDYLKPTATSYSAGGDGGDKDQEYGFGFSKKFGYKKMIVTMHVESLPESIPEEVAASYSDYVFRPADEERAGSLSQNPIVMEDTSRSLNRLRFFPIVAEENGETQEPSNRKYEEKKPTAEDNNQFRAWKDNEEPAGKTVLDDEVKDLYLEWFEKEGPKATTGSRHWKSFKNKFDQLYGKQFKEFFGDEYEGEGFGVEKQKKEKDWFADFPKFEYQDQNAKKDDDKWGLNYVYEPKYDFRRNYNFDDNYNDPGWWHKW